MGKCKGKEGYTIGQSLFLTHVVPGYVLCLAISTAPSKIFYPAATMVYTDIQTLRGVSHPVDYGSGIEYAKGLVEAFPASGLQMGLWLNGTAGCRDIVHGKLDDKIHELFANIAEWNLPKVFLRVGYGTSSHGCCGGSSQKCVY